MKTRTFFTLTAASIALVSGAVGADAGTAAAGTSTQKFEMLPLLPEPAQCVEQTGTRIKAADGNCISTLPVTSYGKSEIDLIGATSAGDALRRLDPRVTIHQ
jgi:hypothetical protein